MTRERPASERPNRPTVRTAAALTVAALLLTGCYSARTAWGGLRMMAKRRPVDRLLADPATAPELASRLRSARTLVKYAGSELSLPVGAAYDSYVELGRPYATWTVTAAPELSVEPLVWCFPFAGCVSYRGYFRERRARRFAERLADEGLDVDIGGVRAFSTLGWFRDPLLSSFLDLPEPELAGLLFHELAHRRLYVKGDTTFNESFASVVEEEGVRRWLEARGGAADLAEWLAARRRDEEVVDLALATRAELATAYASSKPDEWKRQRKAALLDELRDAYRRRRPEWGERWDGFFDDGLDNARLASLGAYAELVPALRRLLAAAQGDLERFYAEAEALTKLTPEARRDRLAASPPQAPRSGLVREEDLEVAGVVVGLVADRAAADAAQVVVLVAGGQHHQQALPHRPGLLALRAVELRCLELVVRVSSTGHDCDSIEQRRPTVLAGPDSSGAGSGSG